LLVQTADLLAEPPVFFEEVVNLFLFRISGLVEDGLLSLLSCTVLGFLGCSFLRGAGIQLDEVFVHKVDTLHVVLGHGEEFGHELLIDERVVLSLSDLVE